MDERPDYARYADDGVLLVEIGRLFIAQNPMATVRLPRSIADAAVAAWRRDELTFLADESPAMAGDRRAAGMLALIGLALEAQRSDGVDDMPYEVPAWFVGAACEHADQAGGAGPSAT